MKLTVLAIGVLLQFIALYIAFYLDMPGNIYLATLISVLSICSLITIRGLMAPVCLLAGILIGLSLSHNESDLEFLAKLEDSVQSLFVNGSHALKNIETDAITDYLPGELESTALARQK